MRTFKVIVSAVIILGLVLLGVGCKGEDVTESKSAAPEEISKYYKGLMDSVDAAASFSDLEFEGLIGEQRLGVSILDQTYDNAPGYEVTLILGMPKEKYAKIKWILGPSISLKKHQIQMD